MKVQSIWTFKNGGLFSEPNQLCQEAKLANNHFAEGAEIIDGKVYQLTLKARKIFVYDSESLELLETLELPAIVKEGWGLTTNGEEIIISDGSQNIYFFDKDLNFNRKFK